MSGTIFTLPYADTLRCEVRHAGRKFTANYQLPPGVWDGDDAETRESIKRQLCQNVAALMVDDLLKMATYTLTPAGQEVPE